MGGRQADFAALSQGSQANMLASNARRGPISEAPAGCQGAAPREPDRRFEDGLRSVDGGGDGGEKWEWEGGRKGRREHEGGGKEPNEAEMPDAHAPSTTQAGAGARAMDDVVKVAPRAHHRVG